jgi:restriction system protein
MPIPDYQTIMLPLLKLTACQRSPLHFTDAVQLVADEFALTAEERQQGFANGKNTPVIRDRAYWAKLYLKMAGLLRIPQRGFIEVTERGQQVLAENLKAINVEYLSQFPEFVEFINRSRKRDKLKATAEKSISTPQEILDEAYLQFKDQILAEISLKIKSATPGFFEKIVLDVVVKMGYGGSRSDAGQAVGRSGDEGIDGVINEDRLGLDVIYLQAKRWEGKVSRPEIQKFAGALHGKRAKKGIFITTSDFTAEALEYVKNIDMKIILISGQQLAELMWEYGVGLNVSATYHIKKLDLDYFNEEG